MERLIVEATSKGVEVIRVQTAPGRRAAGLKLLQRSLAAIRRLGEAASETEAPPRPAARRR